MTTAQIDEPIPRPPLRLWPGVVGVVLELLAWFVAPIVFPGNAIAGVLGGLVGALIIVVWWVFFSRALWVERLGAVVLMIVGLVATRSIIDLSLADAGQGMMFFFVAIPVLTLALVLGAVAGRHLSDGLRRATMVAAILLACGVWTLFRIDGITGDGVAEYAWRWAETHEERLLAQPGEALTALPVAAPTVAEWPGFRGRDRDGVVRGVRIESDWSVSPPVELWRRPIGPGVSSFAVGGERLYTQEQRGDDEVVASYSLATGAPVWRHRDPVRFWDSHAGAGPRSTPTLGDGHVYAFGATGILNALDADTGAVVWSRDVASETGEEAPQWGFTSSPLAVGDVVVVAVKGTLAAYDRATGEPRWTGPGGGMSYSSPHLATLEGVEQVLLLSSAGLTSVAPADGALLWKHPSPGGHIVQPAVTAEGDLLVSDIGQLALGMRLIAVARGPNGWTAEERWTSTRLKPYFNDFVVHDGHAFGFDGSILACIDLEDGERKWKGGRYGHGQLVLLADQNLLLVVSEQGELALVEATPDRFAELARFPALEGKTWNHPVLAHDVLLVRNREEMAAFRLSLASG